ncbi:MAG TPA: hypothetical protein VFI53_04055, partial [Myxococcaceae bacterium]|nr:hypothetical protein [Myxococcaceae bacterium]
RSLWVRVARLLLLFRAAAVLAQESPPPAGAPASPSVEGMGIRWTFFGELVLNANYNTHTMVVGSIPGFVQILSPATTSQFNVSPGNTFLGVTATPPRFGPVQLQARFDMDFRSNAPYLNENAFLPLVRDLYLEATWSRLRILAGQASDIISPRAAASLNFYPLSFIPGDIGDYRPQIRVEWRQPISDVFEMDFQTAIAQAVQTFQVSGTIQATQTGLPDFQGHVGFAFGPERPDGGPRLFECGVAGHIGRRQVVLQDTGAPPPGEVRQYSSWSFVADGSLRVGESTLIEGEYFIGQLLGDYSGAIFQTVDPVKKVPIRARGGWVQVTQQIGPRWTVHAGFGTDDPFDQDLASAERRTNTAVFANAIFRIIGGLRVGLELSWWATQWVDNPTANSFRVETAVLYAF